MRILYICPWYLPAWEYGGSLRVAHATAKRLADRGHDVTVYTTDTAGSDGRVDHDSPITRDGVTIHYFKNISNLLARVFLIPTPVGVGVKLFRTVDSFDVIHIHEFYNLLTIFAIQAARKKDVPYIITPHGTVKRPGESHSQFKYVINTTIGQNLFSNAARIIALTEDERKRLTSITNLANNIEVIPNGISASEYRVQDSTAEEFRKRHNVDDGVLILFLGQLHAWKGLDVLVDAAETVESKIDEPVNFVVAGGDHGYKSTLIQEISQKGLQDSFKVLGFISEEDKKAALNAADVFTLPSRGEGQPMAVLEALSCGTPVVISEGCSLPEVPKADAGMVVRPDSKSLADALTEMIENPQQRIRMSINAEKLVESEFSWESVVDRLEDEYQQVATE